MKLEGKVALVTGAGSGIGKAIALYFAKEGADIAVNDLNPSSAEETAEAVKKMGRKAITVVGSVAETDVVKAMMDKTIRELGGIHILVNNAGVPPNASTATLDETTLDAWDNCVKVILRGTYLCSVEAGRWMAENQGGKIVNIASICGVGGFPRHGAYGPAKAGVINLTKLLALEWAGNNININSIAPGFVRTPMLEEGFETGGVSKEALTNQVPLGRLAEPDEIAKAALFLVSDDSDFITGVTLPVDGGYLAGI